MFFYLRKLSDKDFFRVLLGAGGQKAGSNYATTTAAADLNGWRGELHKQPEGEGRILITSLKNRTHFSDWSSPPPPPPHSSASQIKVGKKVSEAISCSSEQ